MIDKILNDIEKGRLRYKEQKYLDYLQKSKEARKNNSYKERIIISGDFIEQYEYENPIRLNHKAPIRMKKKVGKNADIKKTKLEQKKMRAGALRRARMNIMRLTNSNKELINFLTLTFDESKFENKKIITEFKMCNYLFMKFIQRLKYKFANLKYLAVPELQGDYYYNTGIKKEFGGAVHYHLLINLRIEAEELAKIWDQGFIKINKIKSINNVGAYVSKYLSKESFNKKYFGKKKFFYSKSLEKPQEFKGEECEAVKMIYLPMHKLLYEKTFTNEYTGEIKASFYKLNRKIG